MSETRRAGIWPLAVMALILGLLVTFVVLRFARTEEPVRPPVRPTEVGTPVPPGTASTARPPDKPDPAAEQAKKDAEEAARLIAQAKTDLEDGRIDAAAERVRQARRLKDSPEAERLDRMIAEVQAQRARAKAERQEARLRELKPEVDKLKEANRWDEALARLDAAKNDLEAHPDYDALRRSMAQYQSEADQSHRRLMSDAVAARDRRQPAAARAKAMQAMRIYPERRDAGELIAVLDREAQSANMVRMPAPPKGIPLKLGDPQRPDEPAREYAGPGFLIDRFETTNEEYQFFVEATGHRAPAARTWDRDRRRVLPGYERQPVVAVTASDAEAFARWAGKRLPTEDEWEYAARYLDGRIYPWGDVFMPTDTAPLCNSWEYGRTFPRFEPTPVGSFANGKSALDVMDLAGNVWEWTSTTAPPREGSRVLRVLKGGSFMTRGEACRASNRFTDDPELAHHDVGFRCVRDLPK